MSARDRLIAAARTRILIIDGAFGTEIQSWKLAEADYGTFRSLAATYALAMTLAVATAEARA